MVERERAELPAGATGHVRRRSLIAGAIGVGAAGALGARVAVSRPSGEDEPVPPTEPPDPHPQPVQLRPVSMAMHIHGSFSEGVGSYEAHLQQAREHGVDVIWWTDHDFRVAAHDHRRAVRFDGLTEHDGNGLSWTWEREQADGLAAGWAEFVPEPRSPDEPGRAMRLVARGDESGALWFRGVAWNWTYSVSLADTTLELDVLSESTAPGRELVLEILSSYHPARAGRPAGRYMLQYRFAAGNEPGRQADGLEGVVLVSVPDGRWERVRLRPVADIQALWPDLVAEDNSLHRLRLGLRAQAGRESRAVVDRLRFDRGAGEGESGVELRRAVLDRYAGEYPDVVHYESFEVSLVRHLNWIGGDLALPELPSPPRRNNDPELAERMIEFMHDHGALVQWCHPLDVAGPETLVRLMIERNNLGADLVEIGRRPHDELRRVLDAAARNAVFFTAVGVTDDHAGQDWLGRADNNITYVWASSTGEADLLDALAAGRAWWVDPARWRGSLDVRRHGVTVLGGVLVTEEAEVVVELVATDLPDGAAVEVVEAPVDYPGADPQPVTPTTVSQDDLGERYEYTVSRDAYVRLIVRHNSDVIGESNPFWVLGDAPAQGIPSARRVIDALH